MQPMSSADEKLKTGAGEAGQLSPDGRIERGCQADDCAKPIVLLRLPDLHPPAPQPQKRPPALKPPLANADPPLKDESAALTLDQSADEEKNHRQEPVESEQHEPARPDPRWKGVAWQLVVVACMTGLLVAAYFLLSGFQEGGTAPSSIAIETPSPPPVLGEQPAPSNLDKADLLIEPTLIDLTEQRDTEQPFVTPPISVNARNARDGLLPVVEADQQPESMIRPEPSPELEISRPQNLSIAQERGQPELQSRVPRSADRPRVQVVEQPQPDHPLTQTDRVDVAEGRSQINPNEPIPYYGQPYPHTDPATYIYPPFDTSRESNVPHVGRRIGRDAGNLPSNPAATLRGDILESPGQFQR